MKRVTSRMVDEWIARAGETRRLRINYNIHETLSDSVQRLFVAAEPASYFRPHRHPGLSEFAMVIRGSFDILLFEDNGVVTERVSIGREDETFGVEIPKNLYHTWIVMTPQSVFFEVKQGPYDPATSSLFAPWSPEENSVGVQAYQAKLLVARAGDRLAP